jgi:hypothetical protein
VPVVKPKTEKLVKILQKIDIDCAKLMAKLGGSRDPKVLLYIGA